MRGEYKEWNFYKHKVLVKIEGYRLERLLTRAAEAGIALRSVKIVSDCEVRCWVSNFDLKRLRKMAGTVCRISVVSEKGPARTLRNIAKRPTLIAGVLLASAIVIWQSLFVSTIRIDGYKGIPEAELRRCLEEAGIYEGVYRPEINWDRAEMNLRATFPQLTWVQLVYEGRVVYLNVEESSGKILSGNPEADENIFVPPAQENYQCTHIVAARSGYVESVNTLWGVALVEPGDYVKKGDVLISGIVPMEPTTYEEDAPKEYFVRARGEVTALVPYRETFNQERYIKGGNQGDEEPAEIVENIREKTEDEVIATLNQQIRFWVAENLPENAEIVNNSLNFSYKKNIIEIGVTMEVRREIGNEKEIFIG